MLDFIEFKKLIQRLSTLTGKSPLIYGKQPQGEEQTNYALKVFYDELKQYDLKDITSAFADKELIREVAGCYSLNAYILEKYIQIHRNRRAGKKKETREDLGEFRYEPPADCAAKLKAHGIDVQSLANDKSLH